MDSLGVRENWHNVEKHAAFWCTKEKAALPWQYMEEKEREHLARALFERIVRPYETPAQPCKTVQPRARLPHMCVVKREHRLCTEVLIDMMTWQRLGTTHPALKVSAVYLALCYSSVSGTFDINNFTEQYKQANRF